MPPRKPRVLILEPTRELAEQVHQTISILAGGGRIRIVSIHGGVKIRKQLTALRQGVETVAACSGRLLVITTCRIQ